VTSFLPFPSGRRFTFSPPDFHAAFAFHILSSSCSRQSSPFEGDFSRTDIFDPLFSLPVFFLPSTFVGFRRISSARLSIRGPRARSSSPPWCHPPTHSSFLPPVLFLSSPPSLPVCDGIVNSSLRPKTHLKFYLSDVRHAPEVSLHSPRGSSVLPCQDNMLHGDPLLLLLNGFPIRRSGGSRLAFSYVFSSSIEALTFLRLFDSPPPTPFSEVFSRTTSLCQTSFIPPLFSSEPFSACASLADI